MCSCKNMYCLLSIHRQVRPSYVSMYVCVCVCVSLAYNAPLLPNCFQHRLILNRLVLLFWAFNRNFIRQVNYFSILYRRFEQLCSKIWIKRYIILIVGRAVGIIWSWIFVLFLICIVSKVRFSCNLLIVPDDGTVCKFSYNFQIFSWELVFFRLYIHTFNFIKATFQKVVKEIVY